MTMNTDEQAMKLVALTSEIVAAHVANNAVAVEEVATLVSNVHTALAGLGADAAKEEAPVPAVPIRSSGKRDYIVCLEDGKKLKMLKRHLRAAYDMSPEEYRAKFANPFVAGSLGFIDDVSMPRNPRQELVIAIAGPAVNGLLTVLSLPFALITGWWSLYLFVGINVVLYALTH